MNTTTICTLNQNEDAAKGIDNTELLENLFFSIDTGTPMLISSNSDMPFHSFKSSFDWGNFCHQNNFDVKISNVLPRLSLVFEPSQPYGKNLDSSTFNFYQEPEIIAAAKLSPLNEEDVTLESLKARCPVISRVLFNLLGDDDAITHFLNWFSYISVKKLKPWTAYIIISGPGRGKNLLFEKVLSKLIGENQSDIIFSDHLTNKFNASDSRIILKAVDELYSANNLKLNDTRKQFLKSDLGSNYRRVEPKGLNSFRIKNHMSYILFSNISGLAFSIDSEDRRFSVCDNKEGVEISKQSWFKGREWLEASIENELFEFARYIASLKIDCTMANTPLVTDAKLLMQRASEEDSISFVRMVAEEKWDELGFDEMNDIINPEELIEECKNLRGIPAAYIKIIMKNMFGSDRLSMRKRLEAIGLYSTTIKKNGKSIRAYRGQK